MRIRSIKPEFWRSDDIASLSREHRLLFVGLWSYVDDNGVGIDDYRQVAADLFALDEDQKEVRDFVREGLATLSRRFLIARYTVGGKSYLAITGWKHQRIDKPAKPRYPGPPPGWTPPPTSEDVPNREDDATPSRDRRETVAPGTEEQGNRGTGEVRRPGNSATDRTRERLGPAHSARAHRLVEAYAATCDRRPPAKLRSQLAVEVDGLIEVDWPDDAIAAALDLWASKALGPGALASVAHELANRRPARSSRSSTDDHIAALLGGHLADPPDYPPLRAIGGA